MDFDRHYLSLLRPRYFNRCRSLDDHLMEIFASSSSKRSIHFQPLAKSGRSYQLHLRNLRKQSCPSILIKEHLGVELLPIGQLQWWSRDGAVSLPHLSLGPLLLLALGAGQGSSELLLLSLLLNLRPHGENWAPEMVNTGVRAERLRR